MPLTSCNAHQGYLGYRKKNTNIGRAKGGMAMKRRSNKGVFRHLRVPLVAMPLKRGPEQSSTRLSRTTATASQHQEPGRPKSEILQEFAHTPRAGSVSLCGTLMSYTMRLTLARTEEYLEPAAIADACSEGHERMSASRARCPSTRWSS